MITLIFGAGASFGSGRCLPSNPPLGNDLFTALVKRGGAFSRLEKQQNKVFIEQGFEAGMATIANDSRQINPLQKEIACYLASFSTVPDNAYTRLFKRLNTVRDKISIATLNYDLLIEQSLAHHKIPFDYNHISGSVPLLKIHGSSNFLPELGGISMTGTVMINCGGFVDGLKTNAASSVDQIKNWCRDIKNNDISPVLAMYAKDKRTVMNKRLIEKIQQNYCDTIAKSSHVIVVGAKYIAHDKHVWEPISNSTANILVVDPYPEATIGWAKSLTPRSIKLFQKSFDTAVWDITKYIRAAALSK